jgi:hypothetical protein
MCIAKNLLAGTYLIYNGTNKIIIIIIIIIIVIKYGTLKYPILSPHQVSIYVPEKDFLFFRD